MKKSLIIITIFFAFMLLLNFLMPLHRDDYDYMLIWGTMTHVSSFGDVAQSLTNHYMTHGGRVAAYAPYITLLWWGKVWFNIANALVYVLFALALCAHAARSTRILCEPATILCAFLLLWITLPHYGEVAVWAAGAAGYLWTGLWVALFFLPYNLHLAGRLHMSAAAAIPMLLLGILAGWSMENLAVTVCAVSFLLTAWAWKHKTLEAWMPAGFTGAFIGFCGLLLAPGNFVRYTEQGSKKGILTHIGNQFAGNGEMLLYILPIVLLLLLLWRLLKIQMLEETGETIARPPRKIGSGAILTLAVIAALLVSYFTGGWIAGGIRDFCIAHIMPALGLTKPKTIYLFSNVMSGFEEMVIYLAGIFVLYNLAKNAAGLSKNVIKETKTVRAKDVFRRYPTLIYAAALFAMAFFNNFVMIAAPTFPVRAAFSSVAMIIIATLAILRMPETKKALAGPVSKIIKIGTAIITIFLAAATVLISAEMTAAHEARIAIIEQHAGSGATLTFPPLQTQNRAMRHLFFVDYDNGVTKSGLCHYYGIGDIVVK